MLHRASLLGADKELCRVSNPAVFDRFHKHLYGKYMLNDHAPTMTRNSEIRNADTDEVMQTTLAPVEAEDLLSYPQMISKTNRPLSIS
jgi:hypothetical protein